MLLNPNPFTLQTKIDAGVAQLAGMIDSAKRSNEDRELQLREQVNTALQKVGHLQGYGIGVHR